MKTVVEIESGQNGLQTEREIVALSIRQPWVELILRGKKKIEVRSWATRYRGCLWLHAGKQIDKEALSAFCLDGLNFETGAIIGRCELVDCIEFNSDSWETQRDLHLNFGPLEKRLFGWVVKDAQRVPPVPLSGRLGLMKMTPLPKGIEE